MVSIDWDAYRQCDTCGARTGEPCLKKSGMTLGGYVRAQADRPHKGRKLRTGR